MTKLLSLAAVFAFTTASFACDAHKDEAACSSDTTCAWDATANDGAGSCAAKPAEEAPAS